MTHQESGITAADFVRSIVGSNGETRIVKITPAMASQILDQAHYQGQRAIKEYRKDKHIERMENGTWDSRVSIVSFAQTKDGKMYLINGRHRLSAIRGFDSPVYTAIQLINADGLEEVGRLYAKYDTKESVRTDGELIDATMLAEKVGVRKNIIEKGLRAAGAISNGMSLNFSSKQGMKNKDFELRSGVIVEWKDEVVQYAEIVNNAHHSIREKLYRGGTMAVALYTLRHQPKKAYDFWMGIAEDDGLRKHDPRKVFLIDMMDRRAGTGSGSKTALQAAKAWNAYYQGRDMKILKIAPNEEIKIAGTPMSKGALK